MFDGFMMTPAALPLLSHAKSRAITPENPTGAPNAGALASEGAGAERARLLGPGWKVSPAYMLQPGETHILADIEGEGLIQSIWMTGCVSREIILRMYWEEQAQPSVECPLSDFFGATWMGNDQGGLFNPNFRQLNSAMVAVNPNRGLNCFWPMPFRRRARITLENRGAVERKMFWQINYTLTPVPTEAAYFHAQFRMACPVQDAVYTILDGVRGQGHYVGTFLQVGLNGPGQWWGEGEVKFYLDGDEYPTICGTGTEDYFLGAYNWDIGGEYQPHCSLYGGMYYVRQPRQYNSQMRFSMFRWHVPDPVRFEQELRITVQDLGFYDLTLYKQRRDDFSSVAFWYQTLPGSAFPPLPDPLALDIT